MKYFSASFMYIFLVWSIIIISIFICGLIISLAFTNISYARREKKRKIYTEKYIDLVSSYITGEPVTIAPIANDLEYEVIADVCDNILIDISGQHAEKLHVLLHSLGVVDYYKNMTHSKSWTKKYIAIEKLEFFRDKSLKDFFMSMIEERFDNNKIDLKLITALSFVADIESLRFITSKLTEILNNNNTLSTKIIEHIYTNIIKSLKEDQKEDELIQFMNEIKLAENVPIIIKRDILIACGSTHLVEANKTIIDYFYSNNDIEIRADAIKALGKIGLPESKEVIIQALKDKSWIIRLVAAKAAVICESTVIYELKTLLKDSEYFVRLNAAKTLVNIGDDGLTVLKNARGSDNAFVRNTVNYVLDLNMN